MFFGNLNILSAVLAGTSSDTIDVFLFVGKIILLLAGGVLCLALLGFLLLWFLCRIVDLNRPQEHDSKFYRFVLKLVVPVIMTLLQMRVHTSGLEKTPKDGRFLLVCNHINDLDPVTLLRYFSGSQLAFITKRENMSMFLVGKLMHKILCQPINRENDREALKTILNCIRLIKEDEVSIAVFPEGYTSLDGKLHKFRHGVFKIATKTKVPIVVCTLQNTNKVFRNAKHLKSTDVQLHLVEVIAPEFYENMTAFELGEYVHSLMAKDLGPELVLQYEEKA